MKIEASFIIYRYNYQYMKEMIKVGENVGVDSVYLNQFQAFPYSGFTPKERCFYADDSDVREELSCLMSTKFRCDVIWPRVLRCPGDVRNVCRWPFRMIQVDGDGNVGGCGMGLLNMYKNGKVYDENVWNNEYFRDLRMHHLKGNLLWPCKSCVESAGVEPTEMIKKKNYI